MSSENRPKDCKTMNDSANTPDCTAVLRYAQGQGLPKGETKVLVLPEALAAGLASDRVDALRTEQDLVCVLLKTTIGYKENFEGRLCCNQPLAPEQRVTNSSGRPYLTIAGYYPFEELYLRKDHGAGVYDVYFDLN
jgi:hypothetical protein